MKHESLNTGLFWRFRLGKVFWWVDWECLPPDITGDDIDQCLNRHQVGDWGDATRRQWKRNDYNLYTARSGEVRSVYYFPNGLVSFLTDLDVPETNVFSLQWGPGKWD